MSIDPGAPGAIQMPRLSDSMEEGTILRWLLAVGEQVADGEDLVEIETDKANMVYASELAGTLMEVVGEGETIAVGAPIARIGGSGESAPAAAAAAAPATSPAPSPAAPTSPARSASVRVKVSPVARRLAHERGVDLAVLSGSGPGGRVVKRDVEIAAATVAAAADATPAVVPASVTAVAETAKGTVEVLVPTKLQETVVRRMTESKATAPDFQLSAEIEMTACVEARAALRRDDGPPPPSLNDMVVKACALALREHPRVNGAYRDGRFELYSRVNVGVAVAAEDALVVPTVFDADRKGLAEIAAGSRALAERVRAGQITPPELAGGTFTVSNLGMYGISSFSAVINPPQAAILAVGEVAQRPLVRDGAIVVAWVMNVTLGCDHRILGGAEGAAFLARVRELLTTPLALAL